MDPFRDIGGAKNANLDTWAMNLGVATNGAVKVGFCTTAAHRAASVLLQAGDKVLFQQDKVRIDPGRPYVKEVRIPSGLDEHDLRASISADGRELIAYSPVRVESEPMPNAVAPPPDPKEIRTVGRSSYLAGLRIEQFHDPGREPEPYWEEALRRDPGDARVNTALGIRELKEANFAEAEQHLRAALARLTANYTSPKNGEPFLLSRPRVESAGKERRSVHHVLQGNLE